LLREKRKAAALLLSGLGPLFPNIRTVIADAGHHSPKLARQLHRNRRNAPYSQPARTRLETFQTSSQPKGATALMAPRRKGLINI
jgi:hypothetical protein